MERRKWYSFEPGLLPKAAVDVGLGIADNSLDFALWMAPAIPQIPILVKIAESVSPEAAAAAMFIIGFPVSMVSVVQGRRFMERYFHIPLKFAP